MVVCIGLLSPMNSYVRFGGESHAGRVKHRVESPPPVVAEIIDTKDPDVQLLRFSGVNTRASVQPGSCVIL